MGRNRNGVIVGGVVAFIGLGLGAFMAWDIMIANLAKRIMAYDNPNPNVPALRAALAHNPNDAAANLCLGRYDFLHHHEQAAIRELQQVAALEPEDSPCKSEALQFLSLAERKTGRGDLALTTLRRLATHHDGFGEKAREYVARHGG